PDHRCAYGRCDVVVAGRDVSDKRTERVEGRAEAIFDLLIDLLLDLVERDMPGAFNHYLNVALPSLGGKFAERLEFGKLGFIAGIRNAARAEAVTERKADVILCHHFYDAIKVLEEEVLLVVVCHPLGKDGSATADDASDALRDHRDVLDED